MNFLRSCFQLLGVACFLAVGAFSTPAHGAYAPPASNRNDFNFNYGWKFTEGNITGASATTFNDAAWADVSLPHTWNDDKFREWIFLTAPVTAADPQRPSGTYYGISWYRKHFTIDASNAGRKVLVEFQGITLVGTFYVNGHSVGYNESAVAPIGIDITPYVNFGSDNVIAVEVNNDNNYKTLGYAGAILPFGQPFNPNFGGINRDVTLHIMDNLHQTLPLYRNLGTVGTYIYPSAIDTLNKTATLTVQSEVENDYTTAQTATFNAVVVDNTGTAVLTLPSVVQAMTPGQKFVFNTSGTMTGLHFWDPTFPYLYKVYTSVSIGGNVVDTQVTTTGVRKFSFAPTFGLEINGHPLYLNGYSPRCSMEWPAVGTPVDWMNEYDFMLMKQANANFVRPMHIAPRKVQVEAADKIGIVMTVPAANNEGDDTDPNIWQERLDDMRDVTIYYRNNPSVLFYEGCNQILTAQHMTDMVNVRKTWDPNGGRLAGLRSDDTDVTAGIREYSASMDNAENQLANPLWDAEYARGEAPRRVWDNYTPMLNPRRDGTSANPKYLEGGYFYIASDYHQALGLNSGNGDFIGDYLFPIPQSTGNPTHAYFRLQNSEDMVLENLAKYFGRFARSVFVQTPAVSASKGVMVGGGKIIWSDSVTDGRMHNTEVTRVSGAVDGARLPKEVFYAMQVAQAPSTTPLLHIVGHWNYPASTVKTMYVVSNTAQVRLQTYDTTGALITDYGLGSTTFFPASILPTGGDQVNNYVFAFSNVAWQPGSIKAIGYDNKGNVVGQPAVITTSGSPVALKLTPTFGPSGQFNADGSDIAWFDVEVVDANGKRCPTYEDTVTFNCNGSGIFLGGYNSGVRYSTNLTHATSGYNLNIECGINRVFVRSTKTAGPFTLNVTGAGLTAASSTITSTAVANTNGLSTVWPQKYTVALGTEPAPIKEGVPPPPVNPPVPPAPATNIVDLGYSGGNTGANVIENVQAGQKIYVDKTYTLPTLPSYLTGTEMIQPYQADAGATAATDQYQFNITDFSYIYLVIDAANAMPANDNNADYQWQKLTDTMTINGRKMNIYKSRLMQPYENGYFADNGYGNSPFDPNSNMYLVFVQSIEQQVQKPANKITASTTQGTNYVAANAIDGNVATRWNASSGTFPQTLTLDLGQAYAIGGYTLNWLDNATRYYQYKIEVSTDNVNFVTSLDQQANKQIGLAQFRVPAVNAYDANGDTVEGRYVRITVTGGSAGAWAAISELQINGIPASLLTPEVPSITSAATASAATDASFTYQIGATGSPTSYAATGLPSGLTLDKTTGIISGTPTASGTSHVSLTATNSTGTSPAVTLTITVTTTPVLPSITSADTAGATLGKTFSYQITASNNPTSFAATGLPAGLTLNASTGIISGTPTASGVSSVSLMASNASGPGSAMTLILTVSTSTALPAITSATTAAGAQGVIFTYQITASQNPISFAATNLPPGLTVNSTGLISGTPTTPGTYNVVLSASNVNGPGAATTLIVTISGSADVNLAIGATATATSVKGTNVATFAIDGKTNTRWESAWTDPQSITIDLGSVDTVHTIVLDWERAAGANYTIQISSDNSKWTTVQTVTGNTSGGIKTYTGINSAARYVKIAGTTRTTQYGYSLWEIQILGTVGQTALKAPAITSAIIDTATVNTAFSYQITASGNPTSFAATGLPAGLSISTTGLISGTPTATGITSVPISATNASGTGSATLALTVSSATANLLYAETQSGTNVLNSTALPKGDGFIGKSATTPITWASSAMTSTIPAGSWTVALWTNSPGAASTVRVDLLQAGTSIGNTSMDVNASGQGNHITTFTIPITSAIAFNNQTLGLKVTQISGAGALIIADGDFPSTVGWTSSSSTGTTTPPVNTGTSTGTTTSNVGPAGDGGKGSPPATMALTFNNTSTYPNSQVYVMIIGIDPSSTAKGMSWFNADTGKFQAMQSSDNSGIGSTAAYVPPSSWGVGSKTYCPYSFNIAAHPSITLPWIGSARMFYSYGNPLYMNNVVDANGKVMPAEPGNPTVKDPNWFFPWDYMEFNWGSGGFNVDTSRVDAFNIPSNFVLKSATGVSAQRGDLPGMTHAQYVTAFQNFIASKNATSTFGPCVLNNPGGKIVNSGSAAIQAGQSGAAYFDAYINKVWSLYPEGGTNYFVLPINGGPYKGQVTSAGQMVFTRAGDTADHYYINRKPTTPEIISCAGVFNDSTNSTSATLPYQLAVQAAVAATFNRAIADDANLTTDWANPATYYQESVGNFYADFWHINGLGGFAYGFPYDDENSQSTDCNYIQPTTMTVNMWY